MELRFPPLNAARAVLAAAAREFLADGPVSRPPDPATMPGMGIGTSIFLVAVGAILRYAITVTVQGVELQTVGLILMIVGIIGLVVSLAVEFLGGGGGTPRDEYSRRP
jgi:hypothetical protein